MSQGIVYYAVGEVYVDQMKTAARQAKNVMPDTPITVFTDASVDEDFIDDVRRIETPEHPLLDYIHRLQESPYERTLFLDTDTYLVDDVSHLFDLLDRFDLAVAPTETRLRADDKYSEDVREDVPLCFPEFNTGVILYKTEAVEELFDDWYRRYETYLENYDGRSVKHDQPMFSEALYHSDTRYATLTEEYNCTYPNLGYVQGKVRILHGQAPGQGEEVPPEEMPPVINKDIEKRIYAGKGFRRVMAYPSPLSKWKYPGPSRWRYRLRRAKRNVGDEGLVQTVKKVLNRSKRLLTV
ncbi:MAG: glycosyltransferase [Candidatus Nanohaloarchaea archaeon]